MAELNVLKRLFTLSGTFGSAVKELKDGKFPLSVCGVAAVHSAVLVPAFCDEIRMKALVITADESDAAKLCTDMRSVGTNALLFPSRDVNYGKTSGVSKEYEHKRTDTLSRIAEGAFDVVVASAEAVMQPVLTVNELTGYSLNISGGDEINIDSLTEKLTALGYVRVEQVDGTGTFARRGGILDLFCTDTPYPVRIEFWGDEIDTISYFDPDTQRRTDTVNSVKITVADDTASKNIKIAELIEKYAETNTVSDKQLRTLRADTEALRSGLPVPFDRYAKAVYPENNTIFDYLSDALVFVSEESAVYEKLENLSQFGNENIENMLLEGCYFDGLSTEPPSPECFERLTKTKKLVYLENFASSHKIHPVSQTEFSLTRSGIWNGDTATLTDDIMPTVSSGGLAVIITANKRAADSLSLSLADDNINAAVFESVTGLPKKGVIITCGALSSGFSIPEINVTVISASRENTSNSRKKAIKRNENAKEITSLEELKKGDYVVHSSHGIGIFDGINAITTSGVTKDYIKIKYAGTDVLYVPVTQLDLVSKYIGSSEDTTVKLNKLSGSDWQNTRRRVRKAVRDIAKQLTELYAKRMSSKGYAFSPDTDMQNDFERRFAYDETEDQLRCINEIKDDMERAVPMDRLLCGDVGFGKTEVALRAAFKAVSEGKQCAMLVPTTILAWQHFRTVKNRFAHFPVQIRMLSRFVSPSEQKKVLSGLRDGTVDMVIGTHRMISSDVNFNDLGLVIIDEEQRFGVAQKEKLKEKHPSVDVLTLSATPIPRTLNMALSGLRDMSSIDEAPDNRFPVQTYVLEQNNAVLYEAISRELRRGGQVYYLYNRVETIERTALRLKKVFPDAEIGIAHGKMSEDELSEIWRRLIEQEIDILVCTTIIETGVDVPNVNTLIIEDADRMGLSQLHQLRGRVGRSPRRAYAYFCYRPNKALSEIASKRLEAMREFTEFGSGFKIAMRDLEIRGAGSVLGGEQHGHLESVGYDMYMRLLTEAISEQKGTVTATEQECLIDINIPAHIPEDYIPALSHRLGMYRRIASIRTRDDISDVTDELCDRFGEPPKPVMGLMEIAYLRNVAASVSIVEITERNGMLLLYLKEISPDAISKMAAAFGKNFFFSAGNKPYFSVKPEKGIPVIKVLEKITAVLS